MARTRAVVVAIVIAATSVAGWWLGRLGPGASTNSATGARFAARVTETVDGDTVHVQTARGPDTVRLLGINTPETHHPTKPVECYGPEASAYAEQRLTGRAVQLELDVEHRDIYGRLLAYIILDGRRFNDELLEQGYARVLIIAPNGAHARTMIEEELAAKRARLGLWGAC
ncbi:MAG: thermonuclease family protein [Acidimicrobiia bacterium]